MDNFSPNILKEIEKEEEMEKRLRKQFLDHFDGRITRLLYQYLRLHKELWKEPAAHFLYERLRKQILARGLALAEWDDSPLPEKIKRIDDYHDMEINYHKEEIEQLGGCTEWLLTLMKDYGYHTTHQ